MWRLLLLCRLSIAGCLIACLHASPTYAHQPDDGPQILVLSPHEDDTVRAPFDLDVRFLPSPDAPIDTETLKVQVRKMWGNVDVTEHIRQFASQGGIHITNAHFPKGHHTVMLQIADERGRLSSKTMTMDVQ
jgi:hypothetical protein